MAGHSKWANIKHRKSANDAKKSKYFAKLVKEITIAAKQGGVSPEHNARLRLADLILHLDPSHDISKRFTHVNLEAATSGLIWQE